MNEREVTSYLPFHQQLPVDFDEEWVGHDLLCIQLSSTQPVSNHRCNPMRTMKPKKITKPKNAGRTFSWGLCQGAQPAASWLPPRGSLGSGCLRWESVRTGLRGLGCRRANDHTSSRTWPLQCPTSLLHDHSHGPPTPEFTTRQSSSFWVLVNSSIQSWWTRLTSGAKYSGVPQNVLVMAP